MLVRRGRSGELSLYNPEGLHDLAVEMLQRYRERDMAAATAALERLQIAMRGLIDRERAAGAAAAAQGLHALTIAHETSIAMALRAFPYLPEQTAALRRCYEGLAQAFDAAGQ